MNLNELTDETKKIVANFPFPNWSPETWALDLGEEFGELCNAVLIAEKHKHPKRKRSDIIDALCDILFDVLMLADVYNLNLEDEYLKVLDQLKEQQRNKEFSD